MLNELALIKVISVLLIFITAAIAGVYPFFKRWRSGITDLPIGQALASGVFLGAGLIHMLGDSSADFITLHYDYPMPFLIACGTFLFFLALEHTGREFYERQGDNASGFALIAVVMLSIHSLFAGAALGLSTHLDVVLMLLVAIVAHKWAASFALATLIAQSHLTRRTGLTLFCIFIMMTPLGIYFGNLVSTTLGQYGLIEPTFNAMAAGTFLYLGTLHGLSRSFMVEKCCSLKNFVYVIVGFAIMALVAIWT